MNLILIKGRDTADADPSPSIVDVITLKSAAVSDVVGLRSNTWTIVNAMKEKNWFRSLPYYCQFNWTNYKYLKLIFRFSLTYVNAYFETYVV